MVSYVQCDPRCRQVMMIIPKKRPLTWHQAPLQTHLARDVAKSLHVRLLPRVGRHDDEPELGVLQHVAQGGADLNIKGGVSRINTEW